MKDTRIFTNKEAARAQGIYSNVSRRVETPAGVAYAVAISRIEYEVWRRDTLLGSVTKHTSRLWSTKTKNGEVLPLKMARTLRAEVERLQLAIPGADIETERYAQALVKKHGLETAKDMTCGPARMVVEQIERQST